MKDDVRRTTNDADEALVAAAERGRIAGLGLSTKLLLLTIVGVMIAEVLVFVPSVANFRKMWLVERLAAAQIASLAADAAPGGRLPENLRDELLQSAQVRSVAFKRGNKRRLILQEDMPPKVDGFFDLRTASQMQLITDALYVFLAPPGRIISVRGHPGFGKVEFTEVVMSESPLKAAMIEYGLNILALSIIISVFAAILVYLALNWLLVRPMTRMMRNMVRFGEDPEDASRIIQPGQRTDEIGTAEAELASMQRQLTQMLQHKNRLAALGLAVSKINHDLRNMLANAQLISDRFGAIDDPTVQRFAPKLIGSLDRAIRLCTETLKYGRAREAPPERNRFMLGPLVDEVAESLGLPLEGEIELETVVDDELVVDGDRDQLYRVLANLMRNAKQALGGETGEVGHIRVWTERRGDEVVIEVSDTGPGVPEQARQNLFKAFQGGARAGGTGLGLAISAELVRAHGGSIALRENAAHGTTFQIVIPDVNGRADLSLGRSRQP